MRSRGSQISVATMKPVGGGGGGWLGGEASCTVADDGTYVLRSGHDEKRRFQGESPAREPAHLYFSVIIV